MKTARQNPHADVSVKDEDVETAEEFLMAGCRPKEVEDLFFTSGFGAWQSVAIVRAAKQKLFGPSEEDD